MAFPIIRTKFLGPTDTKGSRVRAVTIGRRSVTLPWEHAWDSTENHDAAAVALARKLGWSVTLIRCEDDSAGYVYAIVTKRYEGGISADAERIPTDTDEFRAAWVPAMRERVRAARARGAK